MSRLDIDLSMPLVDTSRRLVAIVLVQLILSLSGALIDTSDLVFLLSG